MRPTPLTAAAAAVILLAGFGQPATASPPARPAQATVPPTAADPWQAGRSTPVADPMYPKRGNAGLDVLHYGLDLAWSPTAKRLSGTATLRIRPTRDAPSIVLDFMQYDVQSATVDGVPAATVRVNDIERLTVLTPVVKDKVVTLAVAYQGTPKTTPMPSRRADSVEGLGLRATANGAAWTMQEPYGAFTWYPANDHPSDKALYDIAVTVPKGWSAVASGTPAGVTGNTFRYRSTVPVATYLTTLAIDKYKKISLKGPHKLPLTIWYRPGKDDKFLPYLRKQPKHIAWLEKRFGRYPFASGGIVMVDSSSAMETQQMITMGRKWTNWSRSKEGFDETILHEYAHHWFGNTVTPKTWKDLWLNEGPATYAEFLYANDKYHLTLKNLERWLRVTDAEMRRKSGPPGKPDARYFAEGNVYICPALMLLQLHKKLGSKKFFALMRSWAQDHRNSSQDRASFIRFVNKKTTHNYTKMINTWLDSKKTPK